MNARIAIVALILATFQAHGSEHETACLNTEAFSFAASLIAQGHFVADKKGVWRSDHPSRAQENDFIRNRGFKEYAKWYLALDQRHAVDSKARYKFPFGDFRDVHRSGLLAVKARAHEFGYLKIEDAAAKLLQMIESAGPARQKSVD